VLARLRGLTEPGRLQPVHEPIMRATERQIAFYGDYARTKALRIPGRLPPLRLRYDLTRGR
jgi:hypothetical protein